MSMVAHFCLHPQKYNPRNTTMRPSPFHWDALQTSFDASNTTPLQPNNLTQFTFQKLATSIFTDPHMHSKTLTPRVCHTPKLSTLQILSNLILEAALRDRYYTAPILEMR